MARFEGAAIKTPDHMRMVARILKADSVTILTPNERIAAAKLIDAAMDMQRDITTFLRDAPAEAILICGCAGCEHIKSNLSDLRKIAHA